MSCEPGGAGGAARRAPTPGQGRWASRVRVRALIDASGALCSLSLSLSPTIHHSPCCRSRDADATASIASRRAVLVNDIGGCVWGGTGEFG